MGDLKENSKNGVILSEDQAEKLGLDTCYEWKAYSYSEDIVNTVNENNNSVLFNLDTGKFCTGIVTGDMNTTQSLAVIRILRNEGMIKY